MMKIRNIRLILVIQFLLSCFVFVENSIAGDIWQSAVGTRTVDANGNQISFSNGWINTNGVDDLPSTGNIYLFDQDDKINGIVFPSRPKVTQGIYSNLTSYGSTNEIIKAAAYKSLEAKALTDTNNKKYFASYDDALNALSDWPNHLEEALDEFGDNPINNVDPNVHTKNVINVQALYSPLFGPEVNGSYTKSALDSEMDHIPSQRFSGDSDNNVAAKMMTTPTLTEIHQGFSAANFDPNNNPSSFATTEYRVPTTGQGDRAEEVGFQMDGYSGQFTKKKQKITSGSSKPSYSPTGTNYLNASLYAHDQQNPSNILTSAEKKEIEAAYRAAINVIAAKQAARESVDFIIQNGANLNTNATNAYLLDSISNGNPSATDLQTAQKNANRAMIDLASYNNITGTDKTVIDLANGDVSKDARHMTNFLAHNDPLPVGFKPKFQGILTTLRQQVQGLSFGFLDCN